MRMTSEERRAMIAGWADEEPAVAPEKETTAQQAPPVPE